MRMKAFVLSLVAVAGLALAGCGEEPVPILVSYERDIKPLMNARCIRCHGAGGTLNLDPDVPLPPVFPYEGAPTNGNLTALQDQNGKHGLLHYTVGGDAGAAGAVIMESFLKAPMPPPPAPLLTEREHKLLTTWIYNPLP